MSYSRVSTEIQSGEYKTGLARQDDGFRSFLDQYPNYKAWNQKFEDIGKSAFQAYKNRSALTAIIESAENGDFGNDPCLVISEVSRLTREPQKEANKLLNRIFDAGLSIYVSELGGQIYTEKDQTVYLLFQILFLAAHSESREKSHRINGYHNEKIQRF
ncbi:recombinase family protein [Prochlorococcus sp. MIT 1011]|uniref:recombinase family protein n=1 Tax=Prochlorococcus sp. MIT 1011 TaxID=3082520 RepID=UPI0039B6BA1D